MRAEKVIANLLAADAGIAAIVGAKVYGGAAPDDQKAPLVIFNHQASTPSNVLRAAQSNVVDSVIDVYCVATSYSQLKSLADAVRTALFGKAGSIAGVTVQAVTWLSRGADEYDFELRIFSQQLTFNVNFLEP